MSSADPAYGTDRADRADRAEGAVGDELAGPARAATVELAPGLRLHTGPAGGLLVGGQPLRVLTLNPPAAAAVARWQAGRTPLPAAERDLADRLHALGLATVRAGTTPWTPADVTVVVPVRDRSAELHRCLARIGPCAGVIVVDDGSRHPAAVAQVAARHGARLLTRPNGGSAAARNTGLAATTTPLVAFVDSDVRLEPGWLEALLPALADSVAAPRIVGTGGPRALERFEVATGPLDLGGSPGPVGAGMRIGHVPSAVLLCRVDALGAGFDPGMAIGEDVDLVWRLAAAGRPVRYEPDVVVRHDTRASLRSWCGQRVGYGRSAAFLDARHPGKVAPVVISRWTLPALLALAFRRPGLAALATALGAAGLWTKLPAAPGRAHEAARLSGQGLYWTLVGLTEAAARPWLPALLLAAPVSRTARLAAAGSVAARLVRHRGTRPADLSLPTWAAVRLADDLAYGTGVWIGALGDRRPRVVLPRID